ncbi:brefeldin A-inhibited guanine nucleotide-exchange protein 1 [Elaeis guineensis]|uniref:Brefeldin A-inhibited guanine nucleotide-exchange protein 1 n=1 Tax=Elaeis guineensis var. tenera TaxID=51953 RepID=A0A6I9RMF9_ELAGV|nr:brefeldin A-inhibited guanine nucleotide-exchange protein 1 [Elaeis guineensis]
MASFHSSLETQVRFIHGRSDLTSAGVRHGLHPARGGTSLAGRVLSPILDKIFNNAAWRKHSNLVSACKAAFYRLDAVTDSNNSPSSPLRGFSPSDADTVLRPLALAIDTASTKVAESALDTVQKLFFLGLMALILGEIDNRSDDDEDRPLHSTSSVVGFICGCGGLISFFDREIPNKFRR